MLTLGTLGMGQTGCGCAPTANQSTRLPPHVDITSSFPSFHTQSCECESNRWDRRGLCCPGCETQRRKAGSVRPILFLPAQWSALKLLRERIVLVQNVCFVCESCLPRPRLCPLRCPPPETWLPKAGCCLRPVSHTLSVQHSCSHSVIHTGQRSFTSSTHEIHTDV